jgi:hypothetical protein
MNSLYLNRAALVIVAHDEFNDGDGLRSLGHVVAHKAVVEGWVAPVVLSGRELLALLGLAAVGVGVGGDGAACLLGSGGVAAGCLGGAEVDVEEMHVGFLGCVLGCVCLCVLRCENLFDVLVDASDVCLCDEERKSQLQKICRAYIYFSYYNIHL